jgi:hypothetical protein
VVWHDPEGVGITVAFGRLQPVKDFMKVIGFTIMLGPATAGPHRPDSGMPDQLRETHTTAPS